MILVRTVFHAHHGMITQLVDYMKRVTANVPDRPRIMTDLSGPMNTMIVENRHVDLAAYAKWRVELFASLANNENESVFDSWIQSGANEFYTIEQE